MKMVGGIVAMLAAALLSVSINTARADTVTVLANNPGTVSLAYILDSSSLIARPFHLSVDTEIDQITAFLMGARGSSDLEFQILEDVNGPVGPALYTTVFSGGFDGPVSFDPDIVLAAGDYDAVAISEDGFSGGWQADTADVAPYYYFSGGRWISRTDFAPALQIEGHPVISAPEPISLALFGGAIANIFIRRRSSRRSNNYRL